MRIALISIGIVFLLFSCRKNKFEGCENYQKFIGVWQEKDGVANSTYEFKENGEIIYKKGIDRKLSFRIKKCNIESSLSLFNGWTCYDFQKIQGGGRYFYISPHGDSLWDGGTLTDMESIILQDKQFFTKMN